MIKIGAVKTKTAKIGRRFDSLEQEAFLGLWRTYDRLRALEDELFARYDLTPQQYNALRLLRRDHPCRRSEPSISRHGSSSRPGHHSPARQTRTAPPDRARPSGGESPGRSRRDHAGRDRSIGRARRAAPRMPRPTTWPPASARTQALVAMLQTARHPHEDPDSPWC